LRRGPGAAGSSSASAADVVYRCPVHIDAREM
jgi:hypothetical protein